MSKVATKSAKSGQNTIDEDRTPGLLRPGESPPRVIPTELKARDGKGMPVLELIALLGHKKQWRRVTSEMSCTRRQ
jgi:hypothetical protein